MLGLEARSSFQREPLPRWRRASFQRESPGWMRMLAEPGLFTAGATGAARGTSDGATGTGSEGSGNLGGAAGGVARIAGARGAASANEMAGFGGADKFGERGARSPGSAGENIWRENGSPRDWAMPGSRF